LKKITGDDTLRVAGKGKAIYIITAFWVGKMSATLDRVQIETTPVVEIDTEAPATYIRVSQNPVSRTVVLRDDEILSTMDLDASGKIVGIEVVWPTEFGVEKLIPESGANVAFLPSAIARTRYVSAKRLDL
jgi:uncharacterized protein YuzE